MYAGKDGDWDEVVNILSVYAPQVGREREEKEKFWQKLSEVVEEVPREEKIILAGDLNGHIGERADRYEQVHGGFGYGARNVEGEMLLEFAGQQKLAISNSYFKKEKEKFVTYESGGGINPCWIMCWLGTEIGSL